MDAADIDTIDDEDVLKQMWQVTEDFAEKRRIRARMYKLREKRLKDFYTSDDVMTAGSPSAASLPSQSATSSYSYSTTSATTETNTSSSAMETDETDGINGQNRQIDQKRRNDANQEEDAVSEKIRRKSSVRTKRYQMVLAASGETEESSQTSTTSSRMETTQSAVTSERAMSPDSLSGSQLILGDGPSQKNLTIRPGELNLSVLSDSSYQELKSSSRRREFQEGDILTIQEITETWRRIRESGQSTPVTQRVTLTKTIRQRVSDGAMLEENEDEVIDDIDDENQGVESGSGEITAVDAALRRSSVTAITTIDGIEENVTVAKKKFETGVIDDAISEPDSLDNLDNNLPEPDSLDNHSQADSLEMTQTTFTSMTAQQHQSDSLIRMDADISNNLAAGANVDEQVEELIVSTESKPTRSSNNSTTRSKRTPSESPSRGATSTSPANKKRADSAELRKNTTTTSSNSSSRTGLGGINRSAYSSTNSTSTSNRSGSKTTTTSPSLKGSSSIPRLTSTPISAQKGKKTGVAATESTVQDDSVTEFLQLEKEIQGNKVANQEVKTTGIKRPGVSGNNRPTTPVASRKAVEPIPVRSTTSSTRIQQSSSFSSADKKALTKKADTTTSVSRSSSITSSTRKELASPSSTKPATVLGRPAMIRTVETTRTVTVRDRDEDKPWRMNSSSNSASSGNRSKGISGIGRPARKDLHNNVMSVVEKYVDSEGCALHGSHPHIHDDEDGGRRHGHSPSPPPAVEKPVQQATSDDEVMEDEPVAPQANGVEQYDLAAAVEETRPEEVDAESPRREENIERPKKLSVITTAPMDTELATSPLNKSGSRLSIASPVLGSPSVVKKARSLFRSDSVEGPSTEPSKMEPTPSVSTGGTASISKIRSSFENSSAATTIATSTIKRENTKLWEPANNNNRINKVERPSLVKDFPDSSKSPAPSRNISGLFTKSRSPSPTKDVTAPPAAATRQTTPTPQECTPVADDAVPTSTDQIIEEIEDLTLLENMLNTATNYDDRSRIRAHIRVVKKKLGLSISSPMPSRKAAPTPMPAPKTSFSEPAASRNKLPEMKRKPSEPIQPVAMVAEPKNEPVQLKSPSVEPVVAEQVEPVTVQREQVVEDMGMSTDSTTMMTSEVTESTSRKTSLTQQTKVRKMSQPYDCRSETKEFVPRVAEEQPTVIVAGQVNGDGGATPASSDQEGSSETNSPRLSRAPWRRQSSEANMIKTPTHLPEPESNPETLDITSSYGTGPMDENGRPLFGLGALRRRPTKPLNITGVDEVGGQQSPQPIIIERSQTLTELQKLHESQTAQSKGELEPVEKPRAKLRDTFTNSMDLEGDGDRAEPIISERSQALREIIRIHEQQVSSAEATSVEAPPPSPTRPKAKLKDSFVAPIDSPDEPDQLSSMEQTIERSESFQTIIKRHQELSTSQTPTGPLASPPMKRPGILKKPKDWSSPSPQEVSSPVKDDQMSSSTSSRKTSVEVSTTSMTMESSGTRKASMESSIEIQLNPVQSSSIVVTEIPASGLMDRRASGAAPNYSTIQYNSVQDVKMDNRRGSTQQQFQQPRKFSVEVEPSPTMHTSSVTLATATTTNPAGPIHSRVVPTVASAPFVLSGDTTGHSVRSTSTFQLSTSGRNSSVVTAPIIPTSIASVAPVPTGDDPTPWRRKSIPREPSIPRDVDVIPLMTSTFVPAVEIPSAQPQQPVPTRVSMAQLPMQDNLPPALIHSSPLAVRSSRISSSSIGANETQNFQRHGSINNRYRPSQPENNAPFGSGGAKPSSEPRVKTLPATGSSVRALAQKFLVTGEEKSQPQVSKSAGYPKAGLIFRSNSFRSQNNADGTGSIGLVRSESLRISPARSRVSMDRQSQERSVDRQSQERSMDRQSQERSMDDSFSTLSSRRESSMLMSSSERRTSSSYNQSSVVNGVNEEPSAVTTPGESLTSSTMFTTTSKSFLQDRTPVRGMQDIIGRMRATDAGTGNSEDERSLSLLNKLIGAQILVQCTEQAASSAGVTGADIVPSRPETSVQSFSSTSEQRSADGTRLSRTSTQQRTGSSFESGQEEDGGASWTRRSSSTANFQTTRTSTVHQPQQFNISATISDDHIGNGLGGIEVGTAMAQTSTSIPGVAAAGGRAASVIDGIDINTCTDDFKLNELLDNCNDYETRRQIRARIKTLLSDVKVNDGDSSPSCSSSSSSSHSSTSHCTANSSNVSAVHSDVMDWVRRQAQTHGTTPIDTNQQAAAALLVDPIPNELPPHPAVIQSQESGELFDSGTESGEDSTTQSNHSQSDLNSFMANLAKLSLEQHQIPSTSSANIASQSAAANPPTESESPAGGEFLRQVDSVLDQLKTSLQPDDLAEFNGGSSADQQEVLHQHMASGGLEKQWRIHPQQQTELIGLIDRLKTSLHHLQSSDTPAADTTAVPTSVTPVIPVKSSSAVASASVATATTQQEIKPNVNEKINNETKQVQKTVDKVAASTGKTTITVASPAGSAGSLSGITCVKLRAKTFTNPSLERPVSRPNSFLLNVSHDAASERHSNRLSWRSNSEPNTPVTSPSPTPTPSPLPPPKIHWRSPMDFLAHSTTTTTPASSFRPVWCRDPSSSSGSHSTTTATTPAPGKIKLLEKSGIRGRFVQPELNPAPVVTPKTPAPAVRLPSFSLNKVQPTSPPSASRQQSRPETPQTPPAAVEPITEQPVRLISKEKETKQLIQQKAERATQRQTRKQEPERLVQQQKQSELLTERKRQPEEEEVKTPDALSSSRSKSGSHGNNSNLPWKVKLAKKKAERSQTSAGMDGQVSVDLRKSIRMAAATRKSMEDVRENGGSEEREPVAFKLTSQTSAYPLLKQKSLGELYAPRLPKPFQRSESVGAAASSSKIVTPLNTPEAKSSLLKKFNWNSSRSSSVEPTASDFSSAPQTPLSPDPPSPVVMAAGLMPSKSGHSWVLSMKAAHSPIALKGATVVEENPKAQPVNVEVAQPKAEEEESGRRMQSFDQIQAEDVVHNEEDQEEEEEEVVTVGVLNLGSKDEPVRDDDEPSGIQLERQTSIDLKADPSAGFFTPAETLQIAIHKAAIKASLSRQMSERNIGEPSSPLSTPGSPIDKKNHLMEMKPKKTQEVEAIKSHPQLIRATSSPKLNPPSSVSNAKIVPAAPHPQPESSAEIPSESKKPLDQKEPAASKKILPEAVAPSLPPDESNKKADADVVNPSIQKELQKAEQYIKAAMAPIPSWKERARRSNTVAFSSGSGSSWRPVQAPTRLTIKTENDRKYQSLFQKNAEPHSGGFQARPLPSDPSAGGMWTNKFANIRSSFESRPSSTSTTPTQTRSRRSSADENQSQCVAVTSGHIQFQVKPELQTPSAPLSPAVLVKPSHNKTLTQLEVKQQTQTSTPVRLKVEEPLKKTVKLTKPEDQKAVVSAPVVVNVPNVDPLQRSYTSGSIRSSSVGGISPRQPSSLIVRPRPEEKKEAQVQHVRMTVQPSTVVPVPHSQPEKEATPRITAAIASAPAATLVKSSSARRLRNERSCSSVRTQSSLRSDSKEEDDENEEENEEGDDEASSSTSSDEAEEPDRTVLPAVKVQPPTPAINSSISGLKNLTKILQKFSVPDDKPRNQPNFAQNRMSTSSGTLKKSFSSHQIRSTTTPPAFVGGLDNGNDFSLSRTRSSSGFGPTAVPPSSLTLVGLKSSSGNLVIPTVSHYVDAPGPTLVGLVARNVASSAQSTAGSSNNSIASSALNYSAANLKPMASPSDHSPTSLLMKSVSSSRIVSGARQQLERPKSLVLSTNTSSLTTPEVSPGMVRRNQSLGTKQYEASLSPDSAEKKQREILQFFGTASATAALPVVAPVLAPVPAKTIVAASATNNSSVTKINHARSVLTSRQFSLDNNSGGSDVDELFNQFLADQILSPEAAGHRFIHSNQSPLSHQAVSDHQRSKTSERQSSATIQNNPSKFADRRRAWEASTCTSMTLHSSLMRPSESNISSRPADMIQRSSNSNAFGSSTVQSKTEVTMTRQSNFSRSGQPGQSAFSKFQQLDQSVKSSTSGGPMQGLMGGGLSRSASGIKDFLLQWCQSRTRGYKNVQIENFSSSWNDGLAFCALIHHFYPDAFDFNQLDAKNKRHNFALAFKTADEKAGIAPLLDVEDMVAMARPDWKCVFTYVQSFYRRFKDE